MSSSRSEFKIGFTVLLALLILIFSILWGKQVRLASSAYIVGVRFDDVAGLESGALVLVNGVKKGRVKELDLIPGAVLVHLSIDKSVVLYNDARFEITTPELMGGKVVNIFPGISGVTPSPATVFTGESGGGMNELMKRSSELVDHVEELLSVLHETIDNINKTAGDPRLREAFLSSIRNLDESTERTLQMITLNEGKLNQVMDNLVSTTTDVRNLLETNNADINDAIKDFNSFVTQLDDLTSRLNQVAQMLQSDDGTLGMLINDKEFAGTLSHTIANLDSLTQQIRREGIRTNISLFGRRKR